MANDQPAASNICKKTRRVLLGGVQVDDGQHLHYSVTVDGSKPMFSLACRHKKHFNAADLGPPKKNYDVVWPRSSADEPSPDGEDYTFSMSFAAALKYTLVVELHDATHNRVGVGVIVDADYESENPVALCNEAFVIRTP
jgi:hypothetical protein